MDRPGKKLLSALLLALTASTGARAQFSDELPHAGYYLAVNAFYAGEIRDAERILRRETPRGVRIVDARWIDSICYHAMLGEVLYHQGRLPEAMAEFDQACQLVLAYPNWLTQVKFQTPPRPDMNRARGNPPWGQSQRGLVKGQFPTTEQVLIGDLGAGRAFQEGGVARMPMLWRVNVAEIVRMSALAIRRRNQILGPLAEHDRISRDLAETFTRGNLAPPNHWSGVWINLLNGIAQSGIGKFKEADALLERSLVAGGQFEHPLTCVALLEQGHIAMVRGDRARAAQLLAEASFSAYYFENWDVVSESIWLGWLNHITSGAPGVYPLLEQVAAWAQVNRLQFITARARLAQAESLLWLGQLDAAAARLNDTTRRLGELRTGPMGVQQVYLQAALQMLQGQFAPGGESLARALAGAANVSLRNFRIARTSEMFDARAASPRVAVDLYAVLLADPTPADWLFQPLDSMATMQASHEAAFDRWFLAALDRDDLPLALEVAERAKRRRYLAVQPLGGRLLALSTVLESPPAELSKEAALERQQLLASAPAYRALADAAAAMREKLRAGPVLAPDSPEAKALDTLYTAWNKNAAQRRLLLGQLAVRRVPATMEFPPLRTAEELQQALVDGEALVEFHTAAGDLYGFVVTRDDIHAWRITDARRLRNGVSQLLQALGNYGANRQLSIEELAGDSWQQLARAAYDGILGDARLDIDKTKALTVVPDDVLWYLPFEVLMPGGGQASLTLADRVPLRYGPTAALAISDSRPLRRVQHTGIAIDELTSGNEPVVTDQMIARLEGVVQGALRLPTPLPQAPRVVAPLLDSLVSFDEVALPATGAEAVLPASRGSDTATAFDSIPHGGPQRVVLTGVGTAAEQGLKGSRRAARGARPGDELFLSLCELMADGARTVLVSRWRTGGRTNFELVCEFLRELPNGAPTEAWQRACLLAREAPIDVAREPRLKGAIDGAELPRADHPFFWAGYLLVDTCPREAPEATPNSEMAADGKKRPDAEPAPERAAAEESLRAGRNDSPSTEIGTEKDGSTSAPPGASERPIQPLPPPTADGSR